MARCEERAATREDKSWRDASRLDVAGGEGVAERSAWAEVRDSTCEVKNVTEAPRSLTMGDELGEKGGHSELTIREGSGGGIVDSGERSPVKASEPGSMPKNVGNIVSLPGERGVTGLG